MSDLDFLAQTKDRLTDQMPTKVSEALAAVAAKGWAVATSGTRIPKLYRETLALAAENLGFVPLHGRRHENFHTPHAGAAAAMAHEFDWSLLTSGPCLKTSRRHGRTCLLLRLRIYIRICSTLGQTDGRWCPVKVWRP
jgi:hypothetical protein